ncbi:MAG TPA: hypothetical protein VLL49_03880 [Anaerolineales bacterium]|nr:hypothetical protein [Anaerolineales bacterium]
MDAFPLDLVELVRQNRQRDVVRVLQRNGHLDEVDAALETSRAERKGSDS